MEPSRRILASSRASSGASSGAYTEVSSRASTSSDAWASLLLLRLIGLLVEMLIEQARGVVGHACGRWRYLARVEAGRRAVSVDGRALRRRERGRRVVHAEVVRDRCGRDVLLRGRCRLGRFVRLE